MSRLVTLQVLQRVRYGWYDVAHGRYVQQYSLRVSFVGNCRNNVDTEYNSSEQAAHAWGPLGSMVSSSSLRKHKARNTSILGCGNATQELSFCCTSCCTTALEIPHTHVRRVVQQHFRSALLVEVDLLLYCTTIL